MYKSCNLILHGLCFFSEMIVSCCYAPNDKINNGHPPILFPNYKGEIITKEQLFNRIKEYSSQFKNNSCPQECEGCFKIENKDWDEGEYINYITITHFSSCNADCIYCSNCLEPEERTKSEYKILPLLKYLREQGILGKGLELHIGGGEFSIYDECESIIKEFGMDNSTQIYIPTNAIKYSEIIDKSIKEGYTYIIVSLDCGSRKTYKKIKRIDAFDKVIENIHKYNKGANPNRVSLKYIIIPGINDNINEFKKFLKIAKAAKIKHIRLDIEARYLRSVNNCINPYYIKMGKRMNKLANNLGLSCELYSFFQQSLSKISYKDRIKNFIDYIQLKYLKKGIKKYYTNHRY